MGVTDPIGLRARGAAFAEPMKQSSKGEALALYLDVIWVTGQLNGQVRRNEVQDLKNSYPIETLGLRFWGGYQQFSASAEENLDFIETGFSQHKPCSKTFVFDHIAF